jgi:HK97 family phage portal protein
VVGWIARNFPEAPVRVRRLLADGKFEVVQPGPTGPGFMLRLLERPNPWYSGVLLWMATVVDIFTSGNGYWLKERNGAGRVVRLWWAPSRFIKPMPSDDGRVFIAFYDYVVDGVHYWVDPRDVVHFRDGLDPLNQRLGLSKLASLFREIYTDDEAANFTAVLLTNLGVPGVVLAPAQGSTGGGIKTDPEKVKTAFMEKFGGDRRGEPLVLTSPTDVKVLSFNPQEMQLRELRRIPEERVSAVLGISAIVAGLGAGLDRSTFTNFGEARLAAFQESIVPLQRVAGAELEVQLLPEFADTDVETLDVDFDISKASAMQAALDLIWKRAQSAATAGLLTRGTFKSMVGQPVTADDDVYILANNFLIVAAGGDGPVPAPPAPPKPAIPPSPPQLPSGAYRDAEPAAHGSNGHSAEQEVTI